MTSILTTPYQESKVFDSDAQAFLTATGITDSAQIIAINELCLSLKLYGLWDKLTLIAPIVGGDATSHAFNLKNTTADLVFNGGLTHSANGVAGDQATGYIDLGYKPSAFAQDNFSISLYNKNVNGVNMIVGLAHPRIELFVSDNMYYSLNGEDEPFIPYLSGTGSKGFFNITRDSESSTSIFRDGVQAGTGTGISYPPNEDLNIYALARNNAGTPDVFSNAVLSYISLGEGLSIADRRKEWIIVQQYQINLGRNN